MGTTTQPRSLTPKVRFTARELLAQAQADLWAKEVQTGYTATYSWMANQLGHFALGFLGTYFIDWSYTVAGALLHRQLPNWGWLILDWLLGIFMVYKEFGDYRDAIQSWKDAGKSFPFDNRDVIWDALTALTFLIAGVLVGVQSIVASQLAPWRPLVGFLVTIGLFLVIGSYWLSRKKCFQQAGIPYLFRLANFKRPIGSVNFSAENIQAFAKLSGPWEHLLVTGPPASGKTTLLAAIGAEHSFNMGKVRYMSFAELLEEAVPQASKGIHQYHEVTPTWLRWPWRDSEIVLIDAVDSGAVSPALITPAEARRGLESLPELKLLRERRTVWALGLPSDHASSLLWTAMLADFLQAKGQAVGHADLSSPGS